MRALLVAAFAGFPVAIVLAWVFDITPRGIGVTPPSGEIPASPGRPPRWWLRPLVAAPVMAGIVGAAAWLWTSDLSTRGESEFTRQLRPDELPIVAVLPLENLTGRKELEWAGRVSPTSSATISRSRGSSPSSRTPGRCGSPETPLISTGSLRSRRKRHHARADR